VYARRVRTRVVYQDGATSSGVWRSAAAWLGVLVLACGGPDDGQGSSLPAVRGRDQDEPGASDPDDSSTGDDATNEAGVPPASGDGFRCPAPRPEAAAEGALGWASDPATGECCAYANRDAAPIGWLRFDSQIECRCSTESCPSSLEEAERSLCAVTSPPANVERFVGCGLVAVVDYSGYEWAFEQPSESGASSTPAPRLVGAARHESASSTDAGSTSPWRAGVNFATCDYGPVIECQLCGGGPDTAFPPCQQ
jgi:hypothetical protein